MSVTASFNFAREDGSSATVTTDNEGQLFITVLEGAISLFPEEVSFLELACLITQDNAEAQEAEEEERQA